MSSFSTNAADTTGAIPDKWVYMGKSVHDPIVETYVGKITVLGYEDDKKRSADTAIYDEWGKLVYAVPQTRGNITFVFDVIEVTFACHKGAVALVREVLLNADGKIISDDQINARPRIVASDDYKKNLNLLPIDEHIALANYDYTCLSDMD